MWGSYSPALSAFVTNMTTGFQLLIMTSFFQKENGITLKSQNPTKAEQLGMEQASESCLPPLPISLERKDSTASKATKPYNKSNSLFINSGTEKSGFMKSYWPQTTIGAQVPLDFPSTAWGQMQEQHSRCFIQGTEAAEVTPLMEPYMLLLSANAESGNMTR
uniref:Uncharacterized protein n=1 Tax=Oryza nivara TaxID=4536 RepID=A0A0E0JAD1_ORYNI